MTFQQAGGWIEKRKPSGKRRVSTTHEEHQPKVEPSTPQIDDPRRVNALLKEMQARLPISVRPISALVKLAKKQGLEINRTDNLLIKRVFYTGDEGVIMCDITPSEKSKVALVYSLTHLEVVGDDPLAGEMRSYQQERGRKLSSQRRSSHDGR